MRIMGISVHKALTWWGAVGGGLGMVDVFSLTFASEEAGSSLIIAPNSLITTIPIQPLNVWSTGTRIKKQVERK